MTAKQINDPQCGEAWAEKPNPKRKKKWQRIVCPDCMGADKRCRECHGKGLVLALC